MGISGLRWCFPDGGEEKFDLVVSLHSGGAHITRILIPLRQIPLHRPEPQLGCAEESSSGSVSSGSKAILVNPTLQITGPEDTYRNVFAFGDVAETEGPKMARAGIVQADIVSDNLNALIRGHEPVASYKPRPGIEGALKLTLGKVGAVLTYLPLASC